MNVHISYMPHEAKKAAAFFLAVAAVLQGARAHSKTDPDGRQHMYLKTRP